MTFLHLLPEAWELNPRWAGGGRRGRLGPPVPRGIVHRRPRLRGSGGVLPRPPGGLRGPGGVVRSQPGGRSGHRVFVPVFPTPGGRRGVGGHRAQVFRRDDPCRPSFWGPGIPRRAPGPWWGCWPWPHRWAWPSARSGARASAGATLAVLLGFAGGGFLYVSMAGRPAPHPQKPRSLVLGPAGGRRRGGAPLAAPVKITLNGEAREVAAGTTVAGLVQILGLAAGPGRRGSQRRDCPAGRPRVRGAARGGRGGNRPNDRRGIVPRLSKKVVSGISRRGKTWERI
jgi:hypothetical protein